MTTYARALFCLRVSLLHLLDIYFIIQTLSLLSVSEFLLAQCLHSCSLSTSYNAHDSCPTLSTIATYCKYVCKLKYEVNFGLHFTYTLLKINLLANQNFFLLRLINMLHYNFYKLWSSSIALPSSLLTSLLQQISVSQVATYFFLLLLIINSLKFSSLMGFKNHTDQKIVMWQ